MNKRTFSYVTGRFRDFYRENTLDMPPEISRREWGFIPFSSDGGTRMIRHKSLLEIGDPERFLEQEHPQHVYASASKYKDPGAPTMEAKEWEASDLIFDIDIDEDHLPESFSGDEDLGYGEMLALAKKHLQRLLVVLESDFGFEHVSVVFSGGRGYHVHVRDETVQLLSSQERTEIVSYIKGVGLNIDTISEGEWAVSGHELRSDRIGFSPTGGWSTRVHRELVFLMNDLLELEQKTAEDRLMKMPGVGKNKASMILTAFRENENQIRAGEINVRPGMKALVKTLTERVNHETYAEIDEPVTTDVNRLIRMPGSLHGGHALVVSEIPLEEIEEFDPLVDAVPPTFQRQKIDVTATESVSGELLGESYSFDEGETCRVNEALGIHMMVEGWAEKNQE